MKRTLVSLSILTLSLISNPASAQDIGAINQSLNSNNREILPLI